MFIPDPTFFHPGPGSEFSIPYSGSRIHIRGQKGTDPGSGTLVYTELQTDFAIILQLLDFLF
jgi:hypothetical protein